MRCNLCLSTWQMNSHAYLTTQRWSSTVVIAVRPSLNLRMKKLTLWVYWNKLEKWRWADSVSTWSGRFSTELLLRKSRVASWKLNLKLCKLNQGGLLTIRRWALTTCFSRLETQHNHKKKSKIRHHHLKKNLWNLQGSTRHLWSTPPKRMSQITHSTWVSAGFATLA